MRRPDPTPAGVFLAEHRPTILRRLRARGVRGQDLDDRLQDAALRVLDSERRGTFRPEHPRALARAVADAAWVDAVRRDCGRAPSPSDATGSPRKPVSLDEQRGAPLDARFADARGVLAGVGEINAADAASERENLADRLARVAGRDRALASLLAAGFSCRDAAALLGITERRVRQLITSLDERTPNRPRVRPAGVTLATRGRPQSAISAACESSWYRRHPGLTNTAPSRAQHAQAHRRAPRASLAERDAVPLLPRAQKNDVQTWAPDDSETNTARLARIAKNRHSRMRADWWNPELAAPAQVRSVTPEEHFAKLRREPFHNLTTRADYMVERRTWSVALVHGSAPVSHPAPLFPPSASTTRAPLFSR